MSLLIRHAIQASFFLIFYLNLRLCNGDDLNNTIEILIPTSKAPCAARKEISPCTCHKDGIKDGWIQIECQSMGSFEQIIQTLRNKIQRDTQIKLNIEFSDLEDLDRRKFSDINASIILISLKDSKIASDIPIKSFEGVNDVATFMLIGMKVNQFPGQIFQYMPNIKTFIMINTFLRSVSPSNFESLSRLETLVMISCNLTYIESDTFPQTLNYISLISNNITTLNHTLRNNSVLEWVYLHHNSIESLEEQFYDQVPNNHLKYLDVSYNKLKAFPKTFANLMKLDRLLASNNEIENLNEILRNKQYLDELDLANNRIKWLATNEFENCNDLLYLNLSYNEIEFMNNSLLPLQSLNVLNLTHNKMMEFSLQELAGLKNLSLVDLSYNNLRKFSAFSENGSELLIEELLLQFNQLQLLEGSLSGLINLKYLNLSNNKLSIIPTEFLNGLTNLKQLDVSYNELKTLHDIFKAQLPSLETLYATNNFISELSQHPESKPSIICSMYLQNNDIKSIKADFAENNKCIYQTSVSYVYLDGNSVLCRDDIQEVLNPIESKNKTKIIGQCLKLPNEGPKYNVGQINNTDSSAITVVTLEQKISLN